MADQVQVQVEAVGGGGGNKKKSAAVEEEGNENEGEKMAPKTLAERLFGRREYVQKGGEEKAKTKFVDSMKTEPNYFENYYRRQFEIDPETKKPIFDENGYPKLKLDENGHAKYMPTPKVVLKIFKDWKKAGQNEDIPPKQYIEFLINTEYAPIEAPKPSKLEDGVKYAPEVKTDVFIPRYDPGQTARPMLNDQAQEAKKTEMDLKKAESSKKTAVGRSKPTHYWTVDPATGKSFSDKGLKFSQGQWVEFMGNDMCWHLAPIRRVVKDDDDDPDAEPDWQYYYNIGNQSLVDPRNVRASEEGLKRIYGLRPFAFQQWAVLQTELYVRYQEDHEADFSTLGFKAMAIDLWDWWYNHEKNRDFRAYCEAYDELYPRSWDKLLDHIIMPFKLMDEVSKDKETWNLQGNVSLFAYASVLGSGFTTVVIVLFIQFVVPALLLLVQMGVSGGGQFGLTGSPPLRFNPGYFDTTWDLFCSGQGNIYGRLMQIVVILVYVIKVLPQMFFNFYNTAGDAGSVSSKLNALRQTIWDQGDDTVWMMIGYKLEKYMNTLYIALILTILLFILYLTNDVFSVILNALALEFVYSLDEDLAQQEFFDPGGRWIQAGATELVIRSTLRLEFLEEYLKFCKEYDIDPKQWEEKFGPEGFLRPKRAARDLADRNLMSKKMRYFKDAAMVAKDLNNKMALNNFEESITDFGAIDTLLITYGIKKSGMFARFKPYCCWSIWKVVLFWSKMPEAYKFEVGEAKKVPLKDGDKERAPYVKTKILSTQVGKKPGSIDVVKLVDIMVSRKERNEKEYTITFMRYDSNTFYQGNCKNDMLASNRKEIVEKILKEIADKEAAEQEANEDGKSSVSRIFKGVGGSIMNMKSFVGDAGSMLSGVKLNDNYLNFNNDGDKSDFTLFLEDVKDVLLWKSVFASIGVAMRRKAYGEIAFRLIDGVIDWFGYLYQMTFPFVLLLFFAAAIICY